MSTVPVIIKDDWWHTTDLETVKKSSLYKMIEYIRHERPTSVFGRLRFVEVTPVEWDHLQLLVLAGHAKLDRMIVGDA